MVHLDHLYDLSYPLLFSNGSQIGGGIRFGGAKVIKGSGSPDANVVETCGDLNLLLLHIPELPK